MVKGLEDMMLFDAEKHQYHHRVSGEEYLSVSKFIGLFAEAFDSENISRAIAKKKGISQEEVLKEWAKPKDASIKHGNRIHDALERFERTTTIDKSNDDLRGTIMSIASLYKGYYRSYPEQRLRSDKYKICGTTDKLLQCTSHPKSVFDIDDYKTNLSKGIQFKSDYGKYLLGPLSHLQDCNYNRYALQLSIYAYLFQEMTGKKIGMLNILYIPADNYLAFRRIPVPYMKKEVEAMFAWYEENVLNKQTTVVMDNDQGNLFDEENF